MTLTFDSMHELPDLPICAQEVYFETMRYVILDTDVGSDVDDMLALVLLAHARELRLLGVTTVYGDTGLRARIASAVWPLTGNPQIPFVPGAASPLSGREVIWFGHEGVGMRLPGLSSIDRSRTAEQFLIEHSNLHAGHLEILAIGPLTNIAGAILRDPGFARRLRALYIMGGSYWSDYAEHNIECDTTAAGIVFNSGIRITAVGLDVTLKVRLTEKEINAIRQLPNGLGSLLENQIRLWWKFLGTDYNYPHDPLAALAMIRPDLFLFKNCCVEIKTEEHLAGRVARIDNEGGNVRAAYDLDVSTAQSVLLGHILGH